MKLPIKIKCIDCGNEETLYDEDDLESCGKFGCGRCCGGIMKEVKND